ncbi:hypothetical protein LZK98_06040 [Sphingomonas cannabina]|uniref:hypothetical protein n=1 Tax=Sphingomonas cannabina TaxID=2899123 RepID=UPI001F2ACFF3|nr:hypothetical protein [Sphingomonas cannabina]UIJ46507.1 hypothetical protein LZK98_06040 [Sphingomonas cannabina]
MAADPGGAKLVRVAQVRELRLTRAATEARAAAEEAALKLNDAQAAHLAARETLAEARRAFAATPACGQTRLWLDRCIERLVGAAAALADARARCTVADQTHAEAVRAVGRHQIRSDAIATHRRALVRADRRRAEDRAEADAVMMPRMSMR